MLVGICRLPGWLAILTVSAEDEQKPVVVSPAVCPDILDKLARALVIISELLADRKLRAADQTNILDKRARVSVIISRFWRVSSTVVSGLTRMRQIARGPIRPAGSCLMHEEHYSMCA